MTLIGKFKQALKDKSIGLKVSLFCKFVKFGVTFGAE